MGRGRRKQEERLAEALAAQRLQGRAEGALAEREAAIEQVAASLLRDDVSDAVRLIEEHGVKASGPLILEAAQTAWPKKWRSALGPLILRVMQGAEMITDQGPLALGFDVKSPKLAAYFADYMAELSGGVTETTAKQVTDAIRDGMDAGEGIPQIAGRVRRAGEEFGPARATLIARTETTRAANKASLIQARESGVVKSKRWLATADNRTRPEHRALNGTSVDVNEVFPNGLDAPSEPNCRCTLLFEINTEALRGRAS